MTDFIPDDDELFGGDDKEVDDSTGFDDDVDSDLTDEGYNVQSPDLKDDRGFIARIPLTIDGSVFADLFSSVVSPVINNITLTLQPLFRALGYDDRPDAQRFAEDDIGIEEGGPPELDDSWRGPYYGPDALYSKLQGMRSAWHYIDQIVKVTGDIVDVYYVRVDAPALPQRSDTRRKRHRKHYYKKGFEPKRRV